MNNIIVPKEMYIGYNPRQEQGETIKLGFATDADKKDSAFDKRVETIKRWAGEELYRYEPDESGISRRISIPNPFPPETLDNEPRSKFKIPRHVRRWGWNGGNVVWRVEDPRGFELEIPSENMGQLLMHCTIVNGEIQDQCVWGWNKSGGSRAVLLPVNSEPYAEAMKNTTIKKGSVSIRDVNIGDRIVLKNGAEGIYYGKHNVLVVQYEKTEYTQVPVVIRRALLKLPDGNWLAQAEFKVSLIQEKCKSPMTLLQAMDEVNQSLIDGKRITSESDPKVWAYRYGIGEIALVKDNTTRGKFALKNVSFDDLVQYVNTKDGWWKIVFKHPAYKNLLAYSYATKTDFNGTKTLQVSELAVFDPSCLTDEKIVFIRTMWDEMRRALGGSDYNDRIMFTNQYEYYLIVYEIDGKTFVV